MKYHIQGDLIKREKKYEYINELYIHMVLDNIKEQVMHKNILTVEILIYPLTVFENWGLFWFFFEIGI